MNWIVLFALALLYGVNGLLYRENTEMNRFFLVFVGFIIQITAVWVIVRDLLEKKWKN